MKVAILALAASNWCIGQAVCPSVGTTTLLRVELCWGDYYSRAYPRRLVWGRLDELLFSVAKAPPDDRPEEVNVFALCDIIKGSRKPHWRPAPKAPVVIKEAPIRAQAKPLGDSVPS